MTSLKTLIRWRNQAASLAERVTRGYTPQFHNPYFDVPRVRTYCKTILEIANQESQNLIVMADWSRAYGEDPNHPSPRPTVTRKQFRVWVETQGGMVTVLAPQGYRYYFLAPDVEKPILLGQDSPEEFQALLTKTQALLGFQIPSPGGWPSKYLNARWKELQAHGPMPLKALKAPSQPYLQRKSAQRLLDTLDGRCPWAPKSPPIYDWCNKPAPFHNNPDYYRCARCNGTNQNLWGTIPSIDWQHLPQFHAQLFRIDIRRFAEEHQLSSFDRQNLEYFLRGPHPPFPE